MKMYGANSRKGIRAAVHQPHYFPWIPYMNKISAVDVFVVLDTVQLPRGKSSVLRAKYLDQIGEKWLTIPFGQKGKKLSIKEIRLVDESWRMKHLDKLSNAYHRATYFDWAMPRIDGLLGHYGSLMLAEELLRIISGVCRMLGIRTQFLRASEVLSYEGFEREEYLIALLKAIGAREYVTGRGRGAMRTVDETLFADYGIAIYWQDYQIPKYRHVHGHSFVPQVSVLDALFNLGPEAYKIITGRERADV